MGIRLSLQSQQAGLSEITVLACQLIEGITEIACMRCVISSCERDFTWLGKKVSVKWFHHENLVRTTLGVIEEVACEDVNRDDLVLLTIKPFLYSLTQCQRSRLWSQQNALQIIQSLLIEHHCEANYSHCTVGSRKAYTYIQYNETDWAFMQRVMVANALQCAYDINGILCFYPLTRTTKGEQCFLLYDPTRTEGCSTSSWQVTFNKETRLKATTNDITWRPGEVRECKVMRGERFIATQIVHYYVSSQVTLECASWSRLTEWLELSWLQTLTPGEYFNTVQGRSVVEHSQGEHKNTSPAVGGILAIVTGTTEDSLRLRYHCFDEDESSSGCVVAQLCQPQVRDKQGLQWVPTVGETVYVSCSDGDLTRPVVLGALAHSLHRLPNTNNFAQSGLVTQVGPTRSKKHSLWFDDSEKGGVTLSSAGEYEQTIAGQVCYEIQGQQHIISEQGGLTWQVMKGAFHCQAKCVTLQVGSSSLVIRPECIVLRAKQVEFDTQSGWASKAIACEGDQHQCPKSTGEVAHEGGVILTGADGVTLNGKAIARVGDQAACRVGSTQITTGDPGLIVGGKPCARQGSKTSHGGIVQ